MRGRHVRPRRLWLASALLLAALLIARSAAAQVGSERYASMVVDARTGQVLSAVNADDYRFPASLTKLMTIYLTFEAIRDHKLRFSDPVPVSAWAASMPPTKLGLVPGTSLTVEQAVLGLVTKSANDAATALGELLGGDEPHFAELMTLRARALGMTRTTFRNANGLPDWGQVTTAHDLVILARHLLQDFPEYYHYFSTPYYQFRGRVVLNHQTLLRTYPGTDGLKTGYTEASGYNVVTSTVRNGVRLIGVVLGAATGGERDAHMASLLDQGFAAEGVAPLEVARAEPAARLPGFRVPLFGTAHAAPLLREPIETDRRASLPRRAAALRLAAPPRPAYHGPFRRVLRSEPVSTHASHARGRARHAALGRHHLAARRTTAPKLAAKPGSNPDS